MDSGCIRSFPPYPVISSMLQRELPKDLNGENREKVIKVASEHFADQKATKNNIRIESGLLITALTEGSNLEDFEVNYPSLKEGAWKKKNQALC